MSEIEQEALRRILVDLFLAHPRKGTNVPLNRIVEKIPTETITSKETSKQQQRKKTQGHEK